MVVVIDRWDRNYLTATFPPNDFILAQIRDVPGREWVQSKRFWKIPVGSSPILLANLENHKIPYQLTDNGQRYLMAYRDTRQQLIDIKLRQPETEVLVDGMEYPLRPYQANGVDFITTGKRVLLADDMGLGKTVQALASVLIWGPRTTLIIVMNSIKYNWLAEIAKHTPELRAIVVEGGKTRRKAIWEAPGFHIKICNYQLLEHDKDIMPMNWDCIIADEATSFKASATKTAQRIKHLSSSYALAMSGTPLENHLMEMHSIMEFVRAGILGSRWDFKNRHITYGFNGTISGYKNVQEFHEKITPWMLRRRKKDVLSELPDKQVQRIDIELTNEEARLYAKWRASIVKTLDGMGQSNFTSQNVLTQMLRLKQVVDHPAILEAGYEGTSSKFEAVKEIVEDTDEKVVIFTQFKDMAHILKRHFNCECIEGAVSPQERLAMIKRFEEGDTQVLVSTDAGAYGLNITAASIVVHYDLTWNPAKQAQREDRLHRMGQKNAVNVYNLVAKGTIDEYILDVLFRKMAAFDLFVEQADDAILARVQRMDIEAMLNLTP